VEYNNEDDADLALSFVERNFGPDAPVPGAGGFPEGRRNISADREPENDKDMISIAGTLNWRLNDQWSIKSVTGYRDMNMARAWSNDASGIRTDDNIWINFISESISQEVQLEFDDAGVFRSGDRLQGLLGVFYFNEELEHTQYGGCDSPRNATALSSGCLNGSVPRVMEVMAHQDIEAIAVFGHVSYDFNEQVTLNVGARWTDEEREGANAVFFDFPDFNFTSFFVGNSFSDPLRLKGEFDDFSPSVGIEWQPLTQPLDNTTFYFTYSEGFKSGGFLSGFGTNVVEPEEVENFEFGMKNEFFDRRMRLNIAGFTYDAKNLQFDATIPLPGEQGGFDQRFENAAAQDGKGVEVELEWNVTENLRISGFGSWLDAEFAEFMSDDPIDLETVDPNVPDDLEDLSGNRPRQSPEWSGKIRGEYDFAMGNGGVITFGADWTFKSEQFFTEFNRENMRQDAYSLVNANIRYTSPSERFTVNVWGRNLTDEFVRSGMFASGGGRVITEALLPPVTGGITVGYDF